MHRELRGYGLSSSCKCNMQVAWYSCSYSVFNMKLNEEAVKSLVEFTHFLQPDPKK